MQCRTKRLNRIPLGRLISNCKQLNYVKDQLWAKLRVPAESEYGVLSQFMYTHILSWPSEKNHYYFELQNHNDTTIFICISSIARICSLSPMKCVFFLSDNNDNVNNVASDSLLRCLHCAHCYFLTCWCFVQEQQTVADDWQRHRPIQFQWHVEFPNRSLMIACNECNYDNYSHNYPNHCVTSCCLFDRRKDSARENVEIFCTIFVDRRTT